MDSCNLIADTITALAIKKTPDNVSRGKVSYIEVFAERSSLNTGVLPESIDDNTLSSSSLYSFKSDCFVMNK